MFIDDPEVTAAEAVIDNGSFGKRVVRFETGRLAKQAAGSAMAYLDGETAVLSATTVGKHPKDQFDFFPLTVDVEERQYAAGRIPGSFFRREGRAGTAAILACRLIDRPLRPSFVKGLRNEVQVVETVLAIHPDDDYDVLAINAASMSTQIAGLPFSGPVAGTRLALIDGHWVAFPRYSEQQRATFQMVVAGRVLESGDVAIMMVEAGATEHAWELINAGAVAPTEAVEQMGLAAYINGMAYSNVGLGLVHGMAHPLGGRYNAPHGVANGILLAPVMAFNAEHTGEKYRDIAEAFGVDGARTMPLEEARAAAVEAVAQLTRDLGNPTRISQVGVEADGIEALADAAFADVCTPGNPRPATREDIKALYTSLL